MKYKISKFIYSFILMFLTICLTSCSNNPSDTSYWFSKYEIRFVHFDDDNYNLSTAGSYFEFVSNKDITTTMSIIINVDNYTSAAYLYLNDVQIQSDKPEIGFTYSYNLSLKRGDQIKLHAFWINSLLTNDNGFEIQRLCMNENNKTYILTEFDKIK